MEKEIDGKKSKTPTSPKQKSTKADKGARKASQTTGPIIADEMTAHLNSTFYALFVQSLISKAICMSSVAISKKQAFEHILELSSNVNRLIFCLLIIKIYILMLLFINCSILLSIQCQYQ
jgi:hypothetical protein